MQRRPRWNLLVSTILLMLLLAQSAFGQTYKPIELPEFEAALRQAAQSLQRPILVEGYPVRVAMKAPLKPQTPNDLLTFAAIYDYDVEQKGGCYLLRKRYSRSELPCVTFGELCAVYGSIQRLASRLDVPAVMEPFSNENNRQEKGRSSSPQGRAIHWLYLEAKKQNAGTAADVDIVLSTIHPNAAEVLRGAALSIGTAGNLRRGMASSVPWLARWEQADIALAGAGQGELVLRIPKKPEGTDETPLATLQDSSSGAGFGFDPPADGAKRGRGTLKSFCEFLNARKPAQAMRVDTILEDKPICWFGAESATPEVVLRGAAMLYGLNNRITTQERRLTIRTVADPVRLGDIAKWVKMVLPLPLVRALTPPPITQEGIQPDHRVLLTNALTDRISRAWRERSRGSENIPVAKLNPDAQAACALKLMKPVMNHLNSGEFDLSVIDWLPQAKIRFVESTNEQGRRAIEVRVWANPEPGKRIDIFAGGNILL